MTVSFFLERLMHDCLAHPGHGDGAGESRRSMLSSHRRFGRAFVRFAGLVDQRPCIGAHVGPFSFLILKNSF